jgi:small conductance mechanosensitive channel
MSAPIPIDFSNAWKSSARIVNSAISLLPNLVIALAIFVGFLILASTAKSTVRHLSLRRQHRRNLSLLLGQLAYTLVLILGFLVALSVVAPSFQAADLIKMLGIGSVAIGFAFQNILQNFLAGLLLLMQEPFTLGDWISVTGIEGRVDDIQTRATVIITQEGNRVVIPNAVLFTNPVAVGQSEKRAEPEQSQGSPPGRPQSSRAA